MAPLTGNGPSRRALLPAVAALLFLAALLDVASCAGRRTVAVTPVPGEASLLFAEARAASEAGDRAAARAAAERALALAPDWLAPARVLDELERSALRGPGALADRLRELEERPGDAGRAYLVGRLEGPAGMPRLEEATSLDRDLAWPHHGVAWNRFQAGDARGALAPGRRAVERARDPWERIFFTTALVRYLLALERHDEAIALLEECLRGRAGMRDPERVEAATWLVVCELATGRPVLEERGLARALALLETRDLDEAQCRRVVVAAGGDLRQRRPEVALELEAALAARSGPGRDGLRAELLFQLRAGALALAQHRLARAAWPLPTLDPPRLREVRLAAGDARGAIDAWCANLPAGVRDAQGLPRAAPLRRLVAAARAEDSAAARRELGEALLAAGWFREARGYAAHLAPLDPEAALALEARAARGRVLLVGIVGLFEAVDQGRSRPGPWRPAADDPLVLDRLDGETGPGGSARIDSLEDLLRALQALFDRYHATGPSAAADLAASPVLSHGPAAAVVHPGPRFSAADEVAGRGEEGATVPGLAAELRALGRFGIFGKAVGGGGPDGTVRRVLWTERVEGEHLGVPFRGTVAWCEGADLASRPARAGARITGAALHEGYWIDVASVHDDWVYWCDLERRVYHGDAERTIDPARALASRGPEFDAGRGAAGRRSLYAASGLGDLLRLAVLAERAPHRAPGQAWLVSFEELIEGIAIHEEGHLCDRTRFLPLTRHVFGALGLLLHAGLSPVRVAETLEYRAQLVALCATDDPRIHLADVVDSASNGTGITAHAAAYRRLLADLLEVLDGARDEFPALDGDHYLVHQLHHLGAEEVRDLARRLARRRAMIAE